MSKSKGKKGEKTAAESAQMKQLKSKRSAADKVRSEMRKGILRYYGSGIWQGSLEQMRKNRS